MIKINKDKAVELTKERLRQEREPIFKDLDEQFLRRLEQGLPYDDIIEEKQRLRDVTKKAKASMSLTKLLEITV
jgi:hypothetical protein